MNPQAPSTTGLAKPVAPTGQVPVSPNGAPGIPPVPQGSVAPTIQQQAPTSFDTQGLMNNIADYYQIPRQTALAQASVDQNKYNATTAYENQLQLSSTQAKERLDAGSYKIQQTKNGVQILDPVSGQPVDIGTYVNRTGANPAEVLSKSPNPQDQQFVSDYNNFQQFLNSAMQKSTSKEAQMVYQGYIDANPSLANLTPQQAASAFLQQYGNYFGVPSGQPPSSSQYTPIFEPSALQYGAERNLLYGTTPLGLGQLNQVGSSGSSAIGPPSL